MGEMAVEPGSPLCPQYLLYPVQHPVQHGGGAVHNAAAHTVYCVLADDLLGPVQPDSRKLGRAGGQRLQRYPNAGDDTSSHIGIAPVHHLNGGSGAQVQQGQGRFVLRQGSHGDHNAVAAHLGGGIHLDIQPGLDPRPHHHGLFADQLDHTGSYGVEHWRHHGGDDAVVDVRRLHILSLFDVKPSMSDGFTSKRDRIFLISTPYWSEVLMWSVAIRASKAMRSS